MAKSSRGGFLKIIIFLIVGYFVLNYFNISVSQVFDFVKNILNNILQQF
jgi:hypothetical protein